MILKYKAQLLLFCAVVLGLIFYRKPLMGLYALLTDREWMNTFILSSGPAAPLVFIGFQVLQVVFAPVPGEFTGFAGGYLFGALEGFMYSSMGLALGSIINFWIGRKLGYRLVRRIVPAVQMEKCDAFVSHHGRGIVWILFVFPGFPKDYLCLLLGLTEMPFKMFIFPAGFGRMPGTLLLSLQGQFLFSQNYQMLGIVGGVCLAAILSAVRFRKFIYLKKKPLDKE